MIRIAKSFDFDAAHFLPLVPEGHKCRRLHGHTYRVEVICTGPITDGMILDYAVIAENWKTIHDLLDHRTLNDIPGLGNPTTEVLAPWILERLRAAPNLSFAHAVTAIRVYESTTTWCEASER